MNPLAQQLNEDIQSENPQPEVQVQHLALPLLVELEMSGNFTLLEVVGVDAEHRVVEMQGVGNQ